MFQPNSCLGLIIFLNKSILLVGHTRSFRPYLLSDQQWVGLCGDTSGCMKPKVCSYFMLLHSFVILNPPMSCLHYIPLSWDLSISGINDAPEYPPPWIHLLFLSSFSASHPSPPLLLGCGGSCRMSGDFGAAEVSSTQARANVGINECYGV